MKSPAAAGLFISARHSRESGNPVTWFSSSGRNGPLNYLTLLKLLFKGKVTGFPPTRE
jgi:hypothetical protein